MTPLQALECFFASEARLERGDRLVVAFSGGPDSSALLASLVRWSRHRDVRLDAAHLDHALDPGSARRARGAAKIAADLDVPFRSERLAVRDLRRRGESLEAAARRVRYAFLESERQRRRARWVATAHHREDQAETVLLRLLQGSGPTGLRSIAPRHGRVIRPFLDLPRSELLRCCATRGIVPLNDPSNGDMSHQRNLIRCRLLPALTRESPTVSADLAALAATARLAAAKLERRLERELEPRAGDQEVAIERRRLERLPTALLPAALALLHRRAGAAFPPSARATTELQRQMLGGGRVGVDCGGGWHLDSRGTTLGLRRQDSPAVPFAYTLEPPGEIALPEADGAFRLRRQQVEPWMFAPSSWRVGLTLPLEAADRITVRSRRAGDRIRPFGCAYDRRLKDVLIDRKVPRQERDRLPLLCIDQRVIWVPGVTLDERHRLTGEQEAWVAELVRR